ncbi:MAG TPA: glycosyl hydrolase family 28-related protein, partial [Acidobacteriaceae bacterium]|nr:glycosyl hydrolase family 28-related protein [Acidobacteriaceae bacterium]
MEKHDETDGRNVSPRLTRRQTLPALAGLVGAGIMGSGRAPGEEVPAAVDAGARVYNVRSYGARGDGRTLDTIAVQRAIDACASDGGGIVLIPAGTFLLGSVEVKSNVILRIAAGGKILGSANGHDYHAVDAIPLSGDSTLEDGNWALLYAVNASNVTIEGPGTID